MRTRVFPSPTAFVAVAFVAAACSSNHGGGGDTELVIGVQSEDMGATLSRVHLHAEVDGVARFDSDVTPGPSAFPKEIDLTPVSAASQAFVRVDGFPPTNIPGIDASQPVLTRIAYAPFVAGEKKLLRLRLEQRCVVSVLGGLGGPVCNAPQTCISGRCADAHALVTDLEPYSPGWATDAPDVCRPLNHGPPEVIPGTGQTDYAPIKDGDTLQAELGPQKGHHIWIAVRMRNLKQSGSTTTITGVQPGTNLGAPATAFVFTFDPDEGGYCKLYGLRYQLDADGTDYHLFLGKPLDVTVEVKDQVGETAKATAHINVAPTVLGEPTP